MVWNHRKQKRMIPSLRDSRIAQGCQTLLLNLIHLLAYSFHKPGVTSQWTVTPRNEVYMIISENQSREPTFKEFLEQKAECDMSTEWWFSSAWIIWMCVHLLLYNFISFFSSQMHHLWTPNSQINAALFWLLKLIKTQSFQIKSDFIV